MSTLMTLKPEDAGCWFDSHRGWTINAAIIEEAMMCGWELPQDILASWEETGEYWCGFWQDRDDLYDIAEMAESYLATLAPEGFYIGWNDGDFGMYPVNEEDN